MGWRLHSPSKGTPLRLGCNCHPSAARKARAVRVGASRGMAIARYRGAFKLCGPVRGPAHSKYFSCSEDEIFSQFPGQGHAHLPSNLTSSREIQHCRPTADDKPRFTSLFDFSSQNFPAEGPRQAVVVEVPKGATCETLCGVIAAQLDVADARVVLRDNSGGENSNNEHEHQTMTTQRIWIVIVPFP